MTIASSSDAPKETPADSSSPKNPAQLPGEPTAPPASSGAQSRKKTTGRKKTPTRKKTTRRRGRKSTTTVEPGEAKPGSAPPPKELPSIPPDAVRSVLRKTGNVAHYLGCIAIGVHSGDYPELFRFEPDEIDDLAEPVSNLVKRSRRLAWVVRRFDELNVGLTLAQYFTRTADEAIDAVQAYNAQIPEGVNDDRSAGAPRGADAAPREAAPQVREIPVLDPRPGADAPGDA